MRKVKEEGFDKIFDTQAIFRALTDSMARPGKINQIGSVCEKIDAPESVSKVLAGLVFTLIDGETPYSIVPSGLKDLEEFIRWSVMGQSAESDQADYILVSKPITEIEISQLMSTVKKGTLVNPHQSATIFIVVDGISPERTPESELELELKGPGIETINHVFFSGMSGIWIDERQKANEEYPLGVEMVFVTEKGDLLCLPRTTKVERR